MGWVALWLVCWFIASAVASGKGNGALLGCVLGFLLGPLGLIVVLLLPANQGELEQRQLASGTSKQCPFCAETIKAEATVCRYCGRDVPQLVTSTAQPASDLDQMAQHMTGGLNARDTLAVMAPVLIVVAVIIAVLVWYF